MKYNVIMLELYILEAIIQHSCCVRILLLFVAYTCNNLGRELETIFHNSVKGVE